MKMSAAVLTSPNQWFEPYAEKLARKLGGVPVYRHHNEILEPVECLFILSYQQVISKPSLEKHRFNLVVHASDLPRGKGWAPLFWQVLEGRSEVPFTLFEASEGVDSGDIYMQRILVLTGYELNAELREKQAGLIEEMCLDFYQSPDLYLPPRKQEGQSSFYPRRTPSDSQLDVDRSIREQFNLLRIVDNDAYPAFFVIDGKRYCLQVEEMDDADE